MKNYFVECTFSGFEKTKNVIKAESRNEAFFIFCENNRELIDDHNQYKSICVFDTGEYKEHLKAIAFENRKRREFRL